jgi:diadenosine tetraphosphate (Ap4A) HIT family hydrolase
MCAQGRPDETPHSVRFFAGAVADAYLESTDVQRGYTIVIWRGRHVTDLAHLSPAELTSYSSEVVAVARALHQVFDPKKMNYLTLGNWIPHLHTHLIPRYNEDPAPGAPFPLPLELKAPLPDAQVQADAQRLRDALATT